MIDKALRILIADRQHSHRMNIERLFNHLTYYRVAPVQSLAELLTLVDYACVTFDVLVINAELAGDAPDLSVFCLDHPNIGHALIYNEPLAQTSKAVCLAPGRVCCSPAALPDLQALEGLMARVKARAKPTRRTEAHAQSLQCTA